MGEGIQALTESIRLITNPYRTKKCVSPADGVAAMKRVELLRKMSFGVQVAEDEINELASYFVETNQWSKISDGSIDIIRGEKGAGKSAIYSLLMKKIGDFFDDRTLLVAAENPRGATVFRDLVTDPPTSENEFIALWKVYALTIIAQQLKEYEERSRNIDRVIHFLEEARLLQREFTLQGLLRSAHDYVKRIIKAESIEGGLQLDPTTQMPSGVTGKIVFREPSIDLKNLGFTTIDELFDLLNSSLRERDLKIWVLFDRLDVAFVENHALERNALRALVRAYSDIKHRDQISLKIFLREDIWKRITEQGLREASHLIRYVMLDWTQPSLLNLIMRRLLNNSELTNEFGINSSEVLQDAEKQNSLFYRFFPAQVEQGPQKAPTFKWLVTRCADGTGKTAPREMIHLLNCILEQEITRLEQGGKQPNGDQLFDRSVFKLALPAVSNARLNQYVYAEYATERQFISKLEGQKTEQTIDNLSSLWGLSAEEATKKARYLVDLGLFEQRGTRDEPTFWVPFLYRDALRLVQGRVETED